MSNWRRRRERIRAFGIGSKSRSRSGSRIKIKIKIKIKIRIKTKTGRASREDVSGYFSAGEFRTTVEKGDRHRAATVFPQFRPISARSQSPFSTTRLQFE